MNLPSTLEVMHKLKCGQNIFRRPLIEKMMAEVSELSKALSTDLDHYIEPLPEFKTKYHAPVLTLEERNKAQAYAKKMIDKYPHRQRTFIAVLCIENMRLVKEINEHRAARGIDPLPVHEV